MVSVMLGGENFIEIFKDVGFVKVSTSNCNTTHIDGHYKYVHKDVDSSASLTYEFTAARDGDVYFYIPSKYQRAADVSVNGTEYGTFYDDDTPRGFYLGYFSEGEDIKVKVTLKSDVLYVMNGAEMFYYFDEEVFENCFDELAKIQMTVDAEYKEDHIKGTIKTLTDAQTVMTTIPYDEGWIVKVDGKEVEISKSFDAFISFEIGDAGEHTVEFIYRSDAFVYGLACSVLSLAIFIALIIFEKKIEALLHKKKEKASVCEAESGEDTETTINNDGE